MREFLFQQKQLIGWILLLILYTMSTDHKNFWKMQLHEAKHLQIAFWTIPILNLDYLSFISLHYQLALQIQSNMDALNSVQWEIGCAPDGKKAKLNK